MKKLLAVPILLLAFTGSAEARVEPHIDSIRDARSVITQLWEELNPDLTVSPVIPRLECSRRWRCPVTTYWQSTEGQSGTFWNTIRIGRNGWKLSEPWGDSPTWCRVAHSIEQCDVLNGH